VGGNTRRSGCLKIIVLGLVLIVVLAVVGVVVGDRFVRSEIEQRVGTSVSKSLAGPTTVTIDDRSVLLALARDRFATVRGSAPTAEFSQGTGASAKTLHVTGLTFTASGVTNLRSGDTLDVEHLRSGATVSYAELSRLAGTPVSSAGAGRVKLTQTASVWGASVTIEVTAKPGVSDNRLSLDDPAAKLSGVDVPQSLLRPLLTRITDQATLPRLDGLDYDSLTAGNAGVLVTLSGDGVTLPR
jgi:hypothetical protein